MPAFSQPFNFTSYMATVNNNINSIKFYVECCEIFCVTYIKSFGDNLSSSLYNGTRVFLDISLRNNIALDSRSLSADKKKCLIANIYTSAEQGKTLTAAQTCGIDLPIKTLPLKDSCKNELSQFCGLNGFGNLVDRFYPSNIAAGCSASILCPGVNATSNETLRLQCGASLSNNFMLNGPTRMSFKSLTYPCHTTSATGSTAFVETGVHLMKNRALLNAASGAYVNQSALTPTQQQELSSQQTAVNSGTTFTASVDGNTQNTVNTNVEKDLSSINANVAASKSSSVIMKISSAVLLMIIVLMF